MRILLIHQAFAGPEDPGGTRHFELAKAIVREGHLFTIVASNISYFTGRSAASINSPTTPASLEGLRVLRAYAHSALHRSFVWRVVSFFSFMFSSIWTALRAGQVDLVMGTSPPIFQAFSAWFVSFIRRRPFLLEVRDLWPDFAIDIGILKNPVLIFLTRRLESFLYARATHILVNSPAYLDYLVRKNISLKKITLIPNGVEPSMFDPDEKGERFRREISLENSFIITYAGKLGVAPDIPTIIRAANRLSDIPSIQFVMVGEGMKRASLEAMTEELQLSNVKFIGARPKSQMKEILGASDTCIATLKNIPMFKMTYPHKVFDYMAAGRPIILGIDGVIREVIEASGGVIYVPPGDDEALANAVLILEQNRQRAKEMGLAARDYVTRNFNRHDQARAFVDYIPVIIVGAGRSGTNMLRDVLTALPHFGTWPCDEINYIWRHGNKRHPTDELTPEMATSPVKKYIRNEFRKVCKSQKIFYVVEKTCANSLRVDFVNTVLPDAKYIFLIRDGRDVVSSALKRWIAPLDIPYILKKASYVPISDMPYYASKYLYSRIHRLYSKEKRLSSWGPKFKGMEDSLKNKTLPEVCAEQWVNCVKSAQHSFKKIESNRFIRLRYEDFVSDPVKQFEHITDLLNIKLENNLIRKTINSVSAKSVGNWKTALDEMTLDQISPIINPFLKQYNYAEQ